MVQTKDAPVRVLVVDDDKNILSLYEKILNPNHDSNGSGLKRDLPEKKAVPAPLNLDLFLCQHPPEAIRSVRESASQPFSLAFLDVHLGANEPSGIEVAEEIRKIDEDIEIVFVTGDAALDLGRIASEIPPKDKLFYLNKPFKALEIRQFTESLSNKWLTEKKLKALRLDLEGLVRERTHSLSQANQRLIEEIKEKEKAQESKRQSEANFRKMIELNSDSILIVDGNAKIHFCNLAAEKLFGQERREILSRDFQFPVTAGLRQEISFKNDQDEETVCEMNSVETDWQGAKAFLLVLRDVTERKRMEERLLQSLDRNQAAIKGTIQLIARFLEMKDPYTAGHQKRVSELAFRIAGALGLSEHEREGILMAALIHDIGKISIPSEILSKPGKLSDIEYDLIKTHSQKGFEILKEIEFPWPIAQIVVQHHEKLNGSGYPDGIRGDQIMFPARILTVADVMEAISSHRPYRAALGVDKGLEHISRYTGVFYDPEVVKICVALFREGDFHFKTPGLQARGYTDPYGTREGVWRHGPVVE